MLQRWIALLTLPALALPACAPEPGAGDDDDEPASCDYPEGAVEPMELGEVVSPYRWARGLTAAGDEAEVDLDEAYCGDDVNMEWSPFDVLLFVSIPAW
jgi:hypothetical protein